ncbi:hypothetical protein ACFC0M_06725 [Streptomyces sp. NPDC056149]|uniref:hypothetical protein n=1 Tax=Streptomyces sp. NPDC056149 TaxID=3345728 RepID=UPI0035DE5B78
MHPERSRLQPLTVTWEIETVDGEEGETLARHQAEVMLEVLAWIAERRRTQSASADTDTE